MCFYHILILPCLVPPPMLLCYCINLKFINKEINTMNQEEEIVFSLKKLKRVFSTYWYIVLITFILGGACVGVMTMKAMSKPAASSTNQTVTTAANQNAATDAASDSISSTEGRLSPSGTTYFSIVRYVKVDWSDIYPDVSVSNDKSDEDNYYILSRINNQINYEKEILNDCKNILNYDSFKNDINNALTSNNFTKLTSTDSIACDIYGNDVLRFTIYGQCSVDRIRCILNAAVDSYVKKGQALFNLGNCSTIETNDVYAYNKEKDGKFTALNMSAVEWLDKEMAKGKGAAISDTDAVAPEQAERPVAKTSFKSALMTKKNIVLLLASIILGFGILFCIAVFDQIIDIPAEIDYLGLDKIGECREADTNSARIISERIATIAKNSNYESLSIVSMSAIPLLSSICTDVTNDALSARAFQYPDSYLSGISDINESDGVVIALKSGINKKTALKQLLENLKIDNPNILGFIWIEAL